MPQATKATPEIPLEEDFPDNGGHLSINPQRWEKSLKSKNETAKFNKEYNMAKVLAQNGHKIEMLEEVSGDSSHDIKIDDIKAELKKLSSANNIEREAKKAIKKQGADIVIFEFSQLNAKILQGIERLKRMGIHGKYFASGENKIYNF